MSTDELVRVGSSPVGEWAGAAERGLRARREREAIIAQVLREGPDFGMIPGTGKPTLLKAGAEKIADALSLCPDYEILSTIEDYDRPLFSYRYRCVLRGRGADAAIATGIGSCNSMEGRYRWRNADRKCPSCGMAAIIKGKDEYGGGWICFKKKNGCGAKFSDGDESIEGQPAGKVPNDDVYTLVNTIDKMAQKRALVAACLNLGFSEQFTQDMEDRVEPEPERPTVAQPKRKASSAPSEATGVPETIVGVAGGKPSATTQAIAPSAYGAEQRKRVAILEIRKSDDPEGPLYKVSCSDETVYMTRDREVANRAHKLVGSGVESTLVWAQQQWGKQIVGVETP